MATRTRGGPTIRIIAVRGQGAPARHLAVQHMLRLRCVARQDHPAERHTEIARELLRVPLREAVDIVEDAGLRVGGLQGEQDEAEGEQSRKHDGWGWERSEGSAGGSMCSRKKPGRRRGRTKVCDAASRKEWRCVGVVKGSGGR